MHGRMLCKACGTEMLLCLYSSDERPDANRAYYSCQHCEKEVDLYPLERGQTEVKPPMTFAPEYIDQMSAEELKAHYKEMTRWTLDVYSLIAHWYMSHYEDESQFQDEARASVRFDLLRAVGVEDQFMNLPPIEWREIPKKGDG